MCSLNIPVDCTKQWEILLLLLSSEEKKIDRTTETEVDTLKYFYNNEGVREIIMNWLQQMKAMYARKTCESDTSLKCDEVSLLWRQRGNEKFKVNAVVESYKCYSKSVVYAKPNSLMYALAVANRSATLLRLNKYQECLSDISLSMENGYPYDQLQKLYIRRADCHIELQQRAEARASLDAAIHHVNSMARSATNIVEFERHIELLEKKLQSLERNKEEVEEPIVLPECYLGINPNFNAASNAIELRRNDTVGRHVVAQKDIRRGDVLFSEEPYAWVTLPSEDSVCEMCCKADINVVPCSVCSRTVYCSEQCRTLAVFHSWECTAAQCNLFPTIGIAHLALRVLLISASNGFPTPPLHLPSPCTALQLFRSYTQVDNINIYEIDTPAFYRMFNLVTNFDKMNNTDYTQYALTALMLTLYLENFTLFFEYLPNKLPCAMEADELRLFAASIILRSLGQLVCNGHATLSLSLVVEDDTISRTLTEKEVRRASAIYPSAAMMNHSCDPNIINTFYNSRLIIRCSRELSPGMEVLNCYGPHRARQPTAQRRAELRAQYMFTCNCAACSDHERKDFVLLFSAYACQSCRGPVSWEGREPRCQQCKLEFHPERAMALIDQAEELTTQAESAATIEERCSVMCAAHRVKQQVWHKHHSSLRAAADRLARLYADLGEYGKSMELIKMNIQTLEYQFGSFSVEVAHELRKLSDVMVERIVSTLRHADHRDWCLEAQKVLRKAVQLMELNYGAWEPLIRRLKAHETLVATILAQTSASNTADCVHHNLHYNLKI